MLVLSTARRGVPQSPRGQGWGGAVSLRPYGVSPCGLASGWLREGWSICEQVRGLAHLASPLPPPSQAGWCTACDWMFHQGHSVTKMDQVLMSCDNFLEEKLKTKNAGQLADFSSPR
ncbi:von Willebrand factor C and EGF domain-containing protein [Frankliniella fusca]|uniref:von Willebrand factor C and EGF domain-containing protein n=1 Tax=Frankliniella fusca TaxID=407009 RepID=A0AAE1LU20_9NEOP|nr:von Willebrand factor C and EGF domain-containing protein [Frankliniella fusca]